MLVPVLIKSLFPVGIAVSLATQNQAELEISIDH
ncbi:MAG: hypothetical protein QOD75_2954 [Blastocatellia bacterium]|nr:hypothetical protein [Blastocatellia bacterium]